jgi:hypothetical protein
VALTVKFVSAVGQDGSVVGTTRLDLTPIADPANDGQRAQIGDRYSFPLPALIVVATADGEPIASDYAPTRTIEFEVHVGSSATADQRRAALEALAAELDRERNVLYVLAEGATGGGRWLVTHRAADVAADLRLVANQTWATYPLRLTCDAFAYGPLVTDASITWQRFGGASAAGFGSVSSDQPASEGTAGQWYKTTSAPILGDVDAPATVILQPASGAIVQPLILATREVRYEAQDLLRFHSQLTGTADATASGGSHTRYTPAVGNGVEATAASLIVTGLPEITGSAFGSRQLLGAWRILWRIRRNTSADVWQLRTKQRGTNAPVITPVPYTFTDPLPTGWGWFDGGIVQLPNGDATLGDPDPFGDPYAISETGLDLLATRVSGTGTLDVDYAIALPADYSTLEVLYGSDASWAVNTTDRLMIDGDREKVYPLRDYLVAGGPYHWTASQPVAVAGAPTVKLSATYPTQLFIVADYSGASVLTKTLNVAVQYRPRYLSVV